MDREGGKKWGDGREGSRSRREKEEKKRRKRGGKEEEKRRKRGGKGKGKRKGTYLEHRTLAFR